MNRTQLQSFLQPGESLGAATPIISKKDRGGLLDYTVHHIQSPANADGNSVLYEIPDGGRTEITHVARGITMSVRAVDGRGELVVDRSTGERQIHDLARNLGSVTIGPGDTYYYLNTGGFDKALIVRDDCEPGFQPGDELELRQTTGLVDEPQAGDYLVVRNPRHPGKARTAGVWRVAILDYHDTTADNRRRADQSKFMPTPPHAHALVQRAGEEGIYPARIQVSPYGTAYDIVPHPLAPAELVSEFPRFEAQSDMEVYKRV